MLRASKKEMERGRESAWQSSVQANRPRENVENERTNQCGREQVGEEASERERERGKRGRGRRRDGGGGGGRGGRIYLELPLINFSVSLCLWGRKGERERKREPRKFNTKNQYAAHSLSESTGQRGRES